MSVLLPLDEDVTVCRVNAGGVAAEWVEAGVATLDQATFVCLSTGQSGDEALRAGRPAAHELAAATGARVLSVGCRAVDDGVDAWAWLLGEGVDLASAAFIVGFGSEQLAAAVRSAAQSRGLPVPPSFS